jgi:hypothetical protein
MKILILDECGASVNTKTAYFQLIQPGEAELVIASNRGALTFGDKSKCICKEFDSPSTNAQVELFAMQNGPYDVVYTKQEDLLLRGAGLRELFSLTNGLSPKDALAFRDKATMKELVSKGGFGVPAFKRILTPACILKFVQDNGLPIVVKPCFGSASTGVKVLKTQQDVEGFLGTFFAKACQDLQATGNLEAPGTLMVETFVKGTMYHVNGFAKNGKIQIMWPFAYSSTNLDFTAGKSYGNISIPASDERFSRLMGATQQVLDSLPCPKDTMFHLELFDTPSGYQLCEIAARRPGGSIGLLIDVLVAKQWQELEFRLSCGLSIAHLNLQTHVKVVADLLVPMPKGRLVAIPSGDDFALLKMDERMECVYSPFAKVGNVYTEFSIHHLNTACRFVIYCKQEWSGMAQDLAKALEKMEAWFCQHVMTEAVRPQIILTKNLPPLPSINSPISSRMIAQS